jgi:hypothetical protein
MRKRQIRISAGTANILTKVVGRFFSYSRQMPKKYLKFVYDSFLSNLSYSLLNNDPIIRRYSPVVPAADSAAR